MGTPFDRSNAIWAPHAGHPYDATPRCRRGVRHFGHGIGLAVTQAANISCARRSEAAVGETAGAGTERGGGVGAVTADDEGVEVRELATAGASRPQWGQNIPPVPVGSSAIWHDAHFGDAPQDLGSAGVAGVGPDGRGEPGVAGRSRRGGGQGPGNGARDPVVSDRGSLRVRLHVPEDPVGPAGGP